MTTYGIGYCKHALTEKTILCIMKTFVYIWNNVTLYEPFADMIQCWASWNHMSTFETMLLIAELRAAYWTILLIEDFSIESYRMVPGSMKSYVDIGNYIAKYEVTFQFSKQYCALWTLPGHMKPYWLVWTICRHRKWY